MRNEFYLKLKNTSIRKRFSPRVEQPTVILTSSGKSIDFVIFIARLYAKLKALFLKDNCWLYTPMDKVYRQVRQI